MAVLDTPSLSPSDRAGVRELARLLAELEPERVVVALPATLGATAAAQLLQALRPLGANALAVTHADETDQIGVAVEAACRFGLAPGVHARARPRRRLAAAADRLRPRWRRGCCHEVRAQATPRSPSRWSCPSARRTVTLVPAGGERIPARVLEREPDSLLVAIMVPIEPLSHRQLDGLVLEFIGAARARAPERGRSSVEDPSEPDVLRIDRPRSIEVLQEREYVRIKSARPVLVYGGPDQMPVQSYTVDISGGGLPARGAGHAEDRRRGPVPADAHPGRAADQRHGHGRARRRRGRRAVAFELDQRASTAAGWSASSSSASAPNASAAWKRTTAMAAETATETPPRTEEALAVPAAAAAGTRAQDAEKKAAKAKDAKKGAKAGKAGQEGRRARREDARARSGRRRAQRGRAPARRARGRARQGLGRARRLRARRLPVAADEHARRRRPARPGRPASSATWPRGRARCSCGAGW